MQTACFQAFAAHFRLCDECRSIDAELQQTKLEFCIQAEKLLKCLHVREEGEDQKRRRVYERQESYPDVLSL